MLVIAQCLSQAVVVTGPDRKQQRVMENLLYETPAKTRLECAQLCYNSTSLCSGSMLRGNRCYLYGKMTECPAGSVRYHQELCSCYSSGGVATTGQTFQDLSDVCKKQGMHLLSVNSELEQNVIVHRVLQMGKTSMLFL